MSRSPSLARAVDAALQPFVDRGVLAGAVTLVADADRVLSLQAVGSADIAAGKPLRTDSVFWIASQTKPITATALMLLVEEGRVALDDPVERYLPEFAGLWLAAEQGADHVLLKRPARPVTVADTLRHTSGMPFASALETPTLDRLALADAVRSYALTPLQFEPGTRYQYSNAGTNTAGRILEVVSGMPYETFLERRLLSPLGMKETTFWPQRAQLARLAKPYRPDASGTGLEETTIAPLAYPFSDRRRQAIPAGGLFSTARDVARFCQMVLKGGILDGTRYLSEAAVRQMTRKQTGAALSESYGFGWAVENDHTFGHGGALSTHMAIDAERGRILVFLVQHAGFAGDGGESRAAFQRAVDAWFEAERR